MSGEPETHERPDDSGRLVFPDAPRLELDELLTQIIVRAEEVLATQGRLRGLLAANRTITADLTLPTVLRRIVEAGCQLVRARYGALGVLAPSGGLAEFVHVGLDEQTVARIGHLPEGKGLLGALIDDPRTIRLRSIEDDPRSVGFPPHHPPMTSFLGVPVLVRGKVFGNLYLTERIDGGEFTAEDEELVAALAATAGVAIENARLYEQSQRRQDWLQASAKITRQLLSAEGEEPLQLIAREARQIADADVVTVVLPTESRERMMVEVAAGRAVDDLTGMSYPIERTLTGLALTSGHPVLVDDAGDSDYDSHLSDVLPVGPVMVLPLVGTSDTRGALVIARLRGRNRFDDADLDMATTFANHAALALELSDGRENHQRMVLLEDRDRIARDLHDHVIQRLFAAGLAVESVAARPSSDETSLRLRRVVTELDETIRQIRTSIFQLRGPLTAEVGTMRSAVLSVTSELEPVLGFQPRVTFAGPVDLAAPDASVDDLIAALREALTNVARHARARCVDVTVEANTDSLVLEVTDDGVGIGDGSRWSGLANLRARAEHHGGTFSIGPSEKLPTDNYGQGTCLRWTIPLR
jgi:two-component system, NarL family, sensor histidine kinase DevS